MTAIPLKSGLGLQATHEPQSPAPKALKIGPVAILRVPQLFQADSPRLLSHRHTNTQRQDIRPSICRQTTNPCSYHAAPSPPVPSRRLHSIASIINCAACSPSLLVEALRAILRAHPESQTSILQLMTSKQLGRQKDSKSEALTHPVAYFAGGCQKLRRRLQSL